MSAPPDGISELLHSMQSCICDVKAWATANMLRLNDNKTELMLVTSRRIKHLHSLPTSITISIAQIPFKKSVKNLGLALDCHLTMNAHVSNIARTCYFELRRLASIRRFLTSTATATLVSAFVLSRIDYRNSLLFVSTHDVTSHLQRIQNYAARVILRLPKSSSITIHLKSLHWHPVKVRSTYKIACLCYHCYSSTAPSYVTDMLHKGHCTPATLAPAHTPCLFSINLHTVRQHLVIVHFLLLLLLSGTLFQMISGLPHHCHHLSLVWRHTCFVQLTKTELYPWSLYICAWLGHVMALLMVFPKNALMCKKKVKLINHDCLPILMLLYIMLCIVLAYLMLYIVLAYLMLFAALSNAVCLHNASFLPMISANAFYFHVLSLFIDT